MSDMKRCLHKKNLKVFLGVALLVIAILMFFHVPTRIAVSSLNRNHNLPVRLLERGKDTDFSAFQIEPGFGVTSYNQTEDDGTYLRVDVSMWPDAIFGKQRIDYAYWTKDGFAIYGFSVGDDLSVAENALRRHGFMKTANSDEYCLQYRQFGLIITCTPDQHSGIIQSISVSIKGTNIFGIVY